MPTLEPVRIGILGAARIAPMALVRPARQVPEARVLAVAARDPERARTFAQRNQVPRVHKSYEAMLEDPEIEAIYNPLPNSLHCEWSIRALEAGKHVLCEKPLAANGDEAERMAQAARNSGKLLIEAFHYRYHPLAGRLKEIVERKVLGSVRHVEAHLCVPYLLRGDIRYRFDLAGGALMDVGCYTINFIRFLAGSEPEVTWAEAKLASPDVDRYMTADFRFPTGATGRITCSLLSAVLLRASARVRGDQGEAAILNPWAPHLYHRLRLRNPRGRSVEQVSGQASYTHQLRAFARAVRGGPALPTDAADAVASMRVIDAVYEKAGLPRRGA